MYLRSLFYLCIVLCYTSCSNDKQKIDVSNIQSDIKIIRFDQALFSLDSNQFSGEFTKLMGTYPEFSKIYYTNILNVEDSNNIAPFTKGMIKNVGMKKLYDTTQIVFKDFSGIKKELDLALKNTKYYFPDYEVSSLYTFISEYGMQKFLFSDNPAMKSTSIGIGLDLFLGDEFPYKAVDPSNPNFSDYLTRTYNKQHMIPKIIDMIMDDIYVPQQNANTMIDRMINNGKKLYFKKMILPNTADSLIFEYTAKQMEWVKANELEIWSFFYDEKLINETSISKINKYINPSPNAPSMPLDAPGGTANYIGYRIVEEFMKGGNITAQELFKISDGLKLLNMAKYKPKRK
jgi:hypothetical protein